MKKLILSAVLLLAASVGYSQETTQPLQLTIKSDKQAYEVGEEIKLSMSIENISDKDVLIPSSFISYTDGYKAIRYGLNINVKDSKGNKLEFLGAHFKSSDTGTVLKVGEIRNAFKINLLDWFSINKADKYNVQIVSTSQHSGFIDATSNTITIEVAEKKSVTRFPSNSMKGYELYSWQVGDEWYFSLLPGTNRLKTYEEVTKDDIAIKGISDLKTALEQFPKYAHIAWANWLVGGLNLPSEEIIKEIQEHCHRFGIKFFRPNPKRP